MFLGGVGGLAFAGISLSDTLYALDMGDPAATGHGLITTGGVVTTLAALVPAQVTLLGMGPLGCGWALALYWAVLLWWLRWKTSPLKTG